MRFVDHVLDEFLFNIGGGILRLPMVRIRARLHGVAISSCEKAVPRR